MMNTILFSVIIKQQQHILLNMLSPLNIFEVQAISGWQETVLLPKNPIFSNRENIAYQKSSQSINRKYLRINNKIEKNSQLRIIESLQNIKPSPQTIQKQRLYKTAKFIELSNMDSLKQMAANIDNQSIGKWQKYKQIKCSKAEQKKQLRTKSVLLKMHTEGQDYFGTNRRIISSRSTFQRKNKSQRSISHHRIQEKEKIKSINTVQNNQKYRTIHSKSYMRLNMMKNNITQKQKISCKSFNICISQFDNQQMNRILLCLSKKKN